MGHKIAVAAANFAHVFPAQMLIDIEKNLPQGYGLIRVMTAGIQEQEHDRLLRVLEKEKPCALIGVCISPDREILSEYKKKNVPVILIDEISEGATTITTDNFAGGYIAGEYLANLGKKNIAIITGRMNVEGGYNSKQRTAGFEKALKDKGLMIKPENINEVISYSFNEGAKVMAEYKDRASIPDAIFCAAGDMCALGVIKTSREIGIKIPLDMALIGYDDIDKAQISKPPLTTIRQPVIEMAKKAVELSVTDPEKISLIPQSIILKPELVKRESA